jgi:hypothetical protein
MRVSLVTATPGHSEAAAIPTTFSPENVAPAGIRTFGAQPLSATC